MPSPVDQHKSTAPLGGWACDQVTVAAPLSLRVGLDACAATASTWIEAWVPETAFPQMRPGMTAHIALDGPSQQFFQRIDGTVTDVVSGQSPGTTGSNRFCRVSIRPQGMFFVNGQTYHPLLPGVSIRVMLCTAGGTLMALLAGVRSRPA